jgi:hypothetical protein
MSHYLFRNRDDDLNAPDWIIFDQSVDMISASEWQTLVYHYSMNDHKSHLVGRRGLVGQLFMPRFYYL